MPTLNVFFLPRLTSSQDLVGHTVVVIDVLRATTTMVYALAAGAHEVIPCREVEQARTRAAGLTRPVLLGGERGGLRIEGFDLGNSPQQYTPQRVAGRSIVMTTTNGTRAISQCEGAARVLIGAFVNLSAVCRQLADQSPVDLLCAGTHGEVTREDVLLAGAIVDRLTGRPGSGWSGNDQAALAAEAWQTTSRALSAESGLAETLLQTRGGRNLQQIGQQQDIELAAQVDKFSLVPELDRSNGSIRVP